ncbi:MAG TPA: hypothetical protein VFA22_00855 [Stellaceae bacterium]|nr:hypothetical protein [Stellaceae bacterium]
MKSQLHEIEPASSAAEAAAAIRAVLQNGRLGGVVIMKAVRP